MEIPVINRISDFHVGLDSLQNPSSFLSHLTSSLSGIGSVSIAFNFCKWGAVILAVLATFTGIINRIKILIIRFRREKPSAPPSFPLLADDYSSGYDEDEDEEEEKEVRYPLPSSSSPESVEEEEALGNSGASTSLNWRNSVYEDFNVRGGEGGSGDYIRSQEQSSNLGLRQRRSVGDCLSITELVKGKSVVKLWDGIGLGIGFDIGGSESSENLISVYDVNNEKRIASISVSQTPIPAISAPSPEIIVSARSNDSGNFALKIWDRRLGCRIPAIIAEWRPHLGKIVGISSGGIEKVYVRNDGGNEVRVVGDMRNMGSPLGDVTGSDGDSWWDADDVIVSNDFYRDQQMFYRM